MNNGELHTHTTSEEFSVYWAIILGPLHSAGAGGGVFPRLEGTKHGHEQARKMVTFSLPCGTISLAGYFP